MATRRLFFSDGADSLLDSMANSLMNAGLVASPVGFPTAMALVPVACPELYQLAYDQAVASARATRFERFRRFSSN